MTTVFNNAGQLNAHDRAEAIQQLVRYANMLSSPSSSAVEAETPSFSNEQKEAMLAQALMSAEGKVALGQAMANPIRRNLDYQGVGRKALIVDPLPQGALPVYDKDIDVAAAVISSNGSAPESRVQGDRVNVPEFEVVSNPTIRIAEVKRRRFNVIDRAQQKARQEIQAQEDANIFSAIDFASDTAAGFGGENARVAFAAARLTLPDLLNIKQLIDEWDLVTAKYFMHIRQFTDILALGFQQAGATLQAPPYGGFDPVTVREVLQTGLYGQIWGADIIVSKIVPRGTVYGLAEPEFVGVMPIRQDIEVLPADEPKQLKLGWVVNEIIGIGIVNPRGIASAIAP
jgi:hypothetical protein